MYQVDPDVLEISKALGEDTRFAIFCQITAARTPLTVKDLVAHFGMHHSAIRIHLNKLEEAGLIISRKRHNPGAVGRPQLTFLPNPRALSISLPARDYRLLSQLLLEFIARAAEPEKAQEFAHAWGASHVRTRGHLSDGPLPFDDAVQAFAEEMQILGSTPHDLFVEGTTASFSQSNCPFLELAQRYRPLVCSLHQALHRGMIVELVGQDVDWQHVSRFAEETEQCLVHFALANGNSPDHEVLALTAGPLLEH